MSYIDALFDREHDRIHVVERREGKRQYREYPANYVFYYDDPGASFKASMAHLCQDSAHATTKSSARKSEHKAGDKSMNRT